MYVQLKKIYSLHFKHYNCRNIMTATKKGTNIFASIIKSHQEFFFKGSVLNITK